MGTLMWQEFFINPFCLKNKFSNYYVSAIICKNCHWWAGKQSEPTRNEKSSGLLRQVCNPRAWKIRNSLKVFDEIKNITKKDS